MAISATSVRFLTAEIGGVFRLRIILDIDNRLQEMNYNPYDSPFLKEIMLNAEWLRADNRREARSEKVNSHLQYFSLHLCIRCNYFIESIMNGIRERKLAP